MTRWMGLDVGDKRVGVSMSDPLLMLASPLGVFARAAAEAEQRILKLLEEHDVSKIVVGLPLSEDGTENEQCVKVKAFCRRLSRRTSIEIAYVDEYGSSCESRELLRAGGGSTGIDAAAACLILEQAFNLWNRQAGHK